MTCNRNSLQTRLKQCLMSKGGLKKTKSGFSLCSITYHTTLQLRGTSFRLPTLLSKNERKATLCERAIYHQVAIA